MQSSRYTMIFEAIRELLEEQNAENLTVAAIAQRCNLHISTVNYYFNGKADMMMRFHTYVTNVRTSGLPDIYYNVPKDTLEALKAFIEVVDMELFRVDYSSAAQRRLFLYLFGHMYDTPQIRYYLVDKQEAYSSFIGQVFGRYVSAGIVDSAKVEAGLLSMMLITSGYTFSHYYYDELPAYINLRYERHRLLRELVDARHLPLLSSLLEE